MWLPISMPRRPSDLISSSRLMARDASCIGAMPIPMKCLGLALQSSTMPPLMYRHSASASAAGNQCDSSSGIGETTCTSTSSADMSSMRRAASQLLESMTRNALPPTMTAAPSAPLRSIDGQSGLRPACCGMLPGTKWVWMSMASATTRFPDIVMHRTNSLARNLRAEPTMLLYKQVVLFLIWMQSKNEWHGFADLAQPTLRKRRGDQDRVRERKRKLTAPIENIVIAGAGQAGGRAAEALRARRFQGAITILGEESHPPYERPQLSKAMLHSPDAPVAYIKQARDWGDVLNVRLETGAAVIDCDADRRTVSTADGRSFAFDRLLIATGTRPRRLAVLEKP